MIYPQENPGYQSEKIKMSVEVYPVKNIRIMEKENLHRNKVRR